MTESFADQIVRKVGLAPGHYNRLVLAVAPVGAGKTTALQEVRNRTGAPLVNVNLELSRRMLELTECQRALQPLPLLREIVGNGGDETILLDNIEVIFDISLQQDPLRLLQELSRNKTVVAAWSGIIVENSLTYAAPGHPENKRYPIRDFLVVSPELTI